MNRVGGVSSLTPFAARDSWTEASVQTVQYCDIKLSGTGEEYRMTSDGNMSDLKNYYYALYGRSVHF